MKSKTNKKLAAANNTSNVARRKIMVLLYLIHVDL